MLDTYGSYSVLKDASGLPIKLGHGAWGDVYKVFNGKIHCYAALRLIPRSSLSDEDGIQFATDVRAAAYLRSRSLASVFPLETVGDNHLYASEFCDGETLAERVDREGPLSKKSAQSVGTQIAAALDTAAGLVHRRLSPRNIILLDDDEDIAVKVVDFALPNPPQGSIAEDGDCDFRSPEEITGQALDLKSTIFSFGALLYFILAGQEEYKMARAKLLAGDAEVSNAFQEFGPGFAAILDKTFQPEPSERIDSFAEISTLLENALKAPAHTATPARAVSHVPPKTSPPATERRSEPKESPPTVIIERSARPAVPVVPIVPERPAESVAIPTPVSPAPPPERQEETAPPQEIEPIIVESAPPPPQQEVEEPDEDVLAESATITLPPAQLTESKPAMQVEVSPPPEEAESVAATELSVEEPTRPESRPKALSPTPENPLRLPTEPPPKKKIPLWAYLAGAGVLLVGVIVFIFRGSNQNPGAKTQSVLADTQATETNSAPQTNAPSETVVPPSAGPLTVETDPPGAMVSLDQGRPEQAPHTFDNVSFGDHRLSATMDGYSPLKNELQFIAETTWRMQLKPLQHVISDPLKPIADRIKSAPPNSAEYLTEAAVYLQQAQQHPPGPNDIDPQTLRENLVTVFQGLLDKQAPMKNSDSRRFYEPFSSAAEEAAQLDILPAILLAADNEEPHQAFKWYYYAAVTKQDPYAMMKLARSYANGSASSSGERNDEEAFIWFQRSAQAGNKTAAAYLCECYLAGLGTTKNQEKAVQDLKGLAQEGVGPAECLLGLCYINGWGGLDKQSTPSQRQAAAIGLFTKGTEHGEWNGFALLGQVYESGVLDATGQRLPPDLQKAQSLYKQGADNEDPDSRFFLGRLLYGQATAGQGSPTLKHRAIELILQAAKANVPPAREWRDGHPADVKEFEAEFGQ